MKNLLMDAFDDKKISSYPANINNFHSKISNIIETFWYSHGNKVTLPFKSFAIEELKDVLKSGGDANAAFKTYFDNLIKGAIFATLVPPPGLLVPGIYNKLLYAPPFLYDFDSYEIITFEKAFKLWLNSCSTDEMWSIYIGLTIVQTPFIGITSL
jgi:hypothetical protein